MQKYIRILTKEGIAPYYHYLSDDKLSLGALVKVPFGRKVIDGAVIGFDVSSEVPADKLRKIEGVYEGLGPLSLEMIKFIQRMADYTMTPHPLVLRMVLSAALTTKTKKQLKPIDVSSSSIRLNKEQKEALKFIKRSEGYSAILLNGVSGSGKTEVFFEALREKVEEGFQVLIMMPEIALTSNFVRRFKDRFGIAPLEWHSELSIKEKREVWHAVHDGSAQVVIGARSSLFLPFKKLGLVIVDEEHDTSYKQEDNVIYHARDMAVMRASLEGIPVVLSSATPSLETVINAKLGRYLQADLKHRYNEAKMPCIEMVDMKANKPAKLGKTPGFISPKLLEEIGACLKRKEQALLFLNRKGYAPLVLCGSCGHRYQCPNCSSWLVQHRKESILRCHQCNYQMKNTEICVKCHEEHTLIPIGPGIERIEAEVRHYFPDARISSFSADNISRKDAYKHMEKIVSSEVDIIIGTQVLAKGYHFPNLTLVGVVDSDMGLEGGDLRALEKTYQLLNQVSGRAGREKKEGHVFLQTYSPGHLLLKSLVEGDAEKFYALEEQSRQSYKLPPFASLVSIITSSPVAKKAQDAANKIAARIIASGHMQVLGPAPAVMYKLNNRYRFRMLIKSPKNFKTAQALEGMLRGLGISSSVRVKVDINPYSFL